MREIVVNHLTRMKGRRICVAGLDPITGEHVRPITERGATLTRGMLRSEGGSLSLGARVNLGRVIPRPSPPEMEDVLFNPDAARPVSVLEPEEYLSLVDASSCEELGEIFGPELKRDGWTFTVPEGQGAASLGCLRIPRDSYTEVAVDRFNRIKLRLRYPGKPIYVPVNDLRCYEADQVTPRPRVLESIQRRLSKGVSLRAMVGLTHPFSPDDDELEPRHWLQINGICLEDAPLGGEP